MIVHFTRASVGTPYLVAAARFERRTGVPVMTVLSTRLLPGERPEPASPASRLKGTARRLLGRDGLGRRRGRVLRDVDVNHASFVQALPDDAHGVVTHFDRIFRPATIARFASLVNLHHSLLPQYRGATPSRDIVAAGETASGLTLHQIVAEIDAGPIRYQERFDIPPGSDAAALDDLSMSYGVPIFERWLEHLGCGTPFPATILDASAIYRSPVAGAASAG